MTLGRDRPASTSFDHDVTLFAKISCFLRLCADLIPISRRTGQLPGQRLLTIEYMKLEILEFPDPRLRTVAKPVESVTDETRQLIDDMFETMYDASGIGLAATQVNVHQRIVVMDLSEERNEPMVFVNPEFEELEGEPEDMQEGCLSVPGFYEEVTRINHVMIRALDREGKPFELEARGLLAVCIQHEMDHLNGKLFVDYLSPLKRNRIRKKLQKQHKVQATG
mgnify:CR=1 FL=1